LKNPKQHSLRSDCLSRKTGYKVAAFYKFVSLPDFRDLRCPIYSFCESHHILGTILLADEGINGTIAGREQDIDRLLDYLTSSVEFGDRFGNLELKFSLADDMPFLRLKVRTKSEIVTFNAPEVSPAKQTGAYIEPEDWNQLISSPDTIVIDTRNDYECEIGTFTGAINPHTKSFTEFKDFVSQKLEHARDKPVAMFCTGGIRCEKASSYLLALGFQQVYHLRGGILKYLEAVPENESLWQGDCFVFDERVAVNHGLKPSEFTLCRACRRPLSPEDRHHPQFEEGIQCSACAGNLPDKSRQRAIERQHQIVLAKSRGIQHLGDQATKDAHKLRDYKNFKKLQERAASLAQTHPGRK